MKKHDPRWLGILITLTAGMAVVVAGSRRPPRAAALSDAAAPRQRAAAAYARLPLRFEPNRGQTDPQVRYLARGRGYALFLTPTGSTLVLNAPRRAPRSPRDKGKSGGVDVWWGGGPDTARRPDGQTPTLPSASASSAPSAVSGSPTVVRTRLV